MPASAVGTTDQHSLQQMFLDGPKDKGCLFLTCPSLPVGHDLPADLPAQWDWLKGKRFGDLLQAEALGTGMAMAQSRMPLAQLAMERADAHAIGALMTVLMAAAVFTGWMLDIDPLDQPAVELGKQLANARLGKPGCDADAARLDAFLKSQAWEEAF
jgi:glucose-6-phosphate isomerase